MPQVVKAYAWARAMGKDGIEMAADISVVANNYMDKKIAAIRGVEKSHPDFPKWRMEMTRWGLGPLLADTGVGTVAIANRMADYGIDPLWMSHEPWVVPEPFTPEAGELWSKEDLDHWIAVAGPDLGRGLQRSRAGQVRAPQPGDPPGQGGSVRGPGALGDDLARLASQAAARPPPRNH